jgi:formate dehydrogenase subunit gamma
MLIRFDRVERALHWVNAALFLFLIATGAVLYIGPLAALVGRRRYVELAHLAAGLALPLPLAIAVAGRWGARLREDIRRFNRWTPDDVAWLRAILRSNSERRALRAQLLDGKFNAGQKLNAAFAAGAGLVMLGTGVIMYWYHPWPLSWRTGATYVHDWFALAVVVVVTGHILYALASPAPLRSMFSGTISRAWADRHAPAWLAEVDSEDLPQ